ncbi:hypothetical protein [Pedobacter sp.]|uniref:hypothetical protein n=1 Tax=Pedobacter sp. TaxID=1411316 RepID=UPI003C67286A
MANKDKVIAQYPKAYSEKFTTQGWNKTTYFLIWKERIATQKERLGEGDTEAQAWKDAWDTITDNLKPIYP